MKPEARFADSTGMAVDSETYPTPPWTPETACSSGSLTSRVLDRLAASLSQEQTDRLRLGIEAFRRRLGGPRRVLDRDVELSYGTWSAATACLDDAGRRLGEEHGLPHGVRELPNTEWRIWRRPGSRRGRPYNSTALREVAEAWRPLLADLDAITEVYTRLSGSAGGLADAYYLARIGTSIPAYLYRRRSVPLRDGVLPSRLAALFKVCAGVHMTIEHIITHGDREAWLAVRGAAPFYEYVEEQGLFIAGTGRVCGGPRPMVLELLRHLFSHETSPAGAEAAVRSDVGDLAPAVEYGIVAARIDLAVQLFGWASLQTLAPCLEGPCEDGGFADALGRAWPQAARDPARVGGAIALGCEVFDHLSPLTGVRSADFVGAKTTPELEALLGEHLAAQGVRDPQLAHRLAGYLALLASARRGFTRLLAVARGLLGQPADGEATLAAVHARLARGETALDVSAALGALGLAVGESDERLELHLPGTRFDL